MLKTSVSNHRLEVVPQLVSAISMKVIIQKEEVQWGCILTITKGGPMLHIREIKNQPIDIQHIFDQYLNVFKEIPK